MPSRPSFVFATRRPGASLALAAVLALLASVAGAQATRSGGGASASSQMMQQYQQLASEKTALQNENTKLKADVEALTKERDALKKERDGLRAKAGSGGDAAAAAKVAAVNADAEQRLAQQRQKMDDLVAHYRETATNLQSVEKQRNELQARSEAVTQKLGECAVRNEKMRDITNDVLNRVDKMGTFSKLTLDEPFTRITRTRMDNLVDETKQAMAGLAVEAPKPVN